VSSLLEIIELMNGDIVLQRADGEGEPLLTMSFSDEAKAFIGDAQIDVVKAMIQAGIEATSMLQLKNMDDSAEEFESYEALADIESVEELIIEEEARNEELIGFEENTDAANDQHKGLGVTDINSVNDDSLGPIRASDLSSSRILH